jgi:hypothetical protein
MRRFISTAIGVTMAAMVLASASSLPAIETTYGQDPVPDTHRSLRPPYMAYGMDPIPVKSPLERWQEFRYYLPSKAQAPDRSYPADVHRWKWWRGTR